MKKITALVLALVMIAALAACGSSGNKEYPGDTMTLEEIAEDILTDVKDLPASQNIPLDAETFEYYAFTAMPEGAEGLAAEGLVSSIAHSVVLMRAADAKGAEELAKSVEDNMNPSKWICVTAEKSTVTVHGSTVLLVMSFTDVADAITANFDDLWK